jgi:hypothetical protein
MKNVFKHQPQKFKNISIEKNIHKRNEFVGYRNWICLCNCVFYDCIVETDNYNKAIDYEII